MDAGLTVTPVSGVVAVAYARPAAAATAPPDANAVTPAAVAKATPNNPPPTDAASTSYFTIDPHVGVIYQVVNTRTQQVIQQVPAQAVVCSRAYSNAIQNGATAFEAQVQAADLYI